MTPAVRDQLMSWIEDCDPTAFRHLLQNTSTPVVVWTPDGKILWCNATFERITGYSRPELTNSAHSSMMDITDDRDDATADISLARELQTGVRADYMMQKSFRRKNSTPIRVIAHSIRYPASSNPPKEDFNCILTTIATLEFGYDYAVTEVKEVRKLLLDLITKLSQPQPTMMNRYVAWYAKSPVICIGVTLFVATLILGNRVIEVVLAVRESLGFPSLTAPLNPAIQPPGPP